VDVQVDADFSEKQAVCNFIPCKWRQNVSPKRRHRPANPHGTKTQQFDNNVTNINVFTAVRTADLL
jgi:hypothetical protein